MKLKVIKLDGASAGSVELGDDIFGLDPRVDILHRVVSCLLYTSPSPRDAHESRMPSSA